MPFIILTRGGGPSANHLRLNSSIHSDSRSRQDHTFLIVGPAKWFSVGFATVDEFSYLARDKFATEVQSLKRLLRFALALHDPEDEFQKSDYYLFIQKLFHKGLFPLRQDVAILTFNYDPYLPYLLQGRLQLRVFQSLGLEAGEA